MLQAVCKSDKSQAGQCSEEDHLDDEWERFQANGCPDWWLLTKYVGQAARTFSHQPFRSTPAAVSEPGSPAGFGTQHRHRSTTAGSQGVATDDKTQHSADGMESQLVGLHKSQPSGPDTKQHTASALPAAVGMHHSSQHMLDALPTSNRRADGDATASQSACGFKGLLGCTGGCVAPCTAMQATDQHL